MKISILIALLIFAESHSSGCDSKDSYERFFAQSKRVMEWSELRGIWLDFRECDDGAFAEGFSDLMYHLFEKRFVAFFDKSIQNDSEFVSFAIRHVDETWPEKSWRAQKARVIKKCPQDRVSVCEKMLRAMTKIETKNEDE